ncbi:MAG: tRNA (uridine(34)/cytosine(34)/5-carboxymethylaminomethyluridine(34)-2'-O)-methyltransferase TrmL [Duodenibacillus sp.]|nr:tRNA (uridine(34)/cytosine(34)/5-carboxymethylaminomethyluridine(34)-2'-O)-methyltransferase TrmL [Duodenibacillus sp.]HBC69742.1 tRNA (uridine(34)/cytosine(34)/5-carboxymethylaminomethyluridine(34)-2'-O)-methyltransferase TrmL [Sutterella sp.]
MFHVVLVHPEIPPNTGNVIRLCANTGCRLHLVKPLGFEVDDKRLIRAGLDYHEFTTMTVYENWEEFLLRCNPPRERMFAMTTKGASVFSRMQFRPGDWLVFGSEGSGLPDAIRGEFPESQRIRLPMRPKNRSLNLSNAVAVTVFEAWRQNGYEGGV